ncbi:hypothetical protein HUU39_16570 [candidate division KSB1 bacterium]|nr:hypothetical protein [bacterium]NUM66852.1 hypothetical protein [candidate division KSB1 bacterium]
MPLGMFLKTRAEGGAWAAFLQQLRRFSEDFREIFFVLKCGPSQGRRGGRQHEEQSRGQPGKLNRVLPKNQSR